MDHPLRAAQASAAEAVRRAREEEFRAAFTANSQRSSSAMESSQGAGQGTNGSSKTTPKKDSNGEHPKASSSSSPSEDGSSGTRTPLFSSTFPQAMTSIASSSSNSNITGATNRPSSSSSSGASNPSFVLSPAASSRPLPIPIQGTQPFPATSSDSGPSARYELAASWRDSQNSTEAYGNYYGIGQSVSDSMGGLQSFMSLNAPASPKRLSALELTFPTLEELGYSSESDDEGDPSNFATRGFGRRTRTNSSRLGGDPARSFDRRGGRSSPVDEDEDDAAFNSDSGTPFTFVNGANGNGKGEKHKSTGRKRLSSFTEFGSAPAPTSLAILSGLISASAKVIDRAYAEQGLPVPDIDDPGLPKSKYAKESKELRITHDVQKAIEVCIEACHQLVGVVQKPEVTCAEAAYAFEVSAALRVTMEAYVVEVLREEGPKGMHITALAQKVKMEPNFLLRIMRLLTAHNIFLEMGAGSQWFANNRVSLRMDSKEPLSRLLGEKNTANPDGPRVEIRSLVSHATDYTWHTAGQMDERLRGRNIEQIQPVDDSEASFIKYRQLNARKCGSYLGDPPNLIQVLKVLGNGLVVDLGSGLGRDLLGVARTYPHLRIELHDKPEVIEHAKDMWYRLEPRAVVRKAVTFHPHDLISSTRYPRASTYLMRNHLVHWNDADALSILKKARASAFPSSRLFVEESTTDDELPDDLSFVPPEILEVLSAAIEETSHNADRIQHLLDVANLLSGNGRKRTIVELALLMKEGGWRVEKVDNSSGGRCKIFIARPIKVEDD